MSLVTVLVLVYMRLDSNQKVTIKKQDMIGYDRIKRRICEDKMKDIYKEIAGHKGYKRIYTRISCVEEDILTCHKISCDIHDDIHSRLAIGCCLFASHLEVQSDPAVPDTVQRQIKFTVATPPTDIIERPRRDKEDMVHPYHLVNALERLAVHELSPLEVSVTNIQPREQCDAPPV